jgi:Na+/H+ antiporter NhaD/arsenite permease-like protein
VYATFIGTLVALALLAGAHQQPHLHHITAMIDFGTLMLLFSMMILVHLLAQTGFFPWISVRIAIVAKVRVII